MMIKAGFREIEHTADWELHVWGPDLFSLLITSAHGMNTLSQTELTPGPREERLLEIHFIDPETLLVDFLSELLFIGEDEGIAFDDFDLKMDDEILKVTARGSRIQKQSKEIKAVTYHGMNIRVTDDGMEVHIVFDV